MMQRFNPGCFPAVADPDRANGKRQTGHIGSKLLYNGPSRQRIATPAVR